jgi:hypothetical protein
MRDATIAMAPKVQHMQWQKRSAITTSSLKMPKKKCLSWKAQEIQKG